VAVASINVVASLAGQTVPVQITRQADGIGQWTPSVPAGKAATNWTKTDNDTGVAVLPTGHGIATNEKVDVFWDGGRRYGMTATVVPNGATDNVTVDLGSGANLPASGTSVVVSKRQVVNGGFDPDDVAVLLISASRRSSVVFVDAGGVTLLALDILPGEFCLWFSNSGITRPMTGNPVTAIWISNGDTAGASDVTVSVMYDATP